MTSQNTQERRQFPRYYTSEGAFVNASKSFGKIVNISLGGMKFHYLNWNENTAMEGELDIYIHGEDVLTKLPFKVLPEPPEAESGSNDNIILKQCRVQFKKLSVTQKNKLEQFIVHQTAGSA